MKKNTAGSVHSVRRYKFDHHPTLRSKNIAFLSQGNASHPPVAKTESSFNSPVILIITRFLPFGVPVKNDFLKEILGTFKERIKTEISSEVIAYVEQEVYMNNQLYFYRNKPHHVIYKFS